MPTGSKQKEILRWLEYRRKQWFTAREIARGVARAEPLTKVSLSSLVTQNLVLREKNESGEYIYNRDMPPKWESG